MKDSTLELLLTALREELQERCLKPTKPTRGEATAPGPWCSRKQAYKWFSIPKGRLERLVCEGKVIAKKFDPEDPNSGVRFRTADIEKIYEEMPDYRFETKRKTHKIKNGVRI